MAVKTSATITLSSVVDVIATTRYYLLAVYQAYEVAATGVHGCSVGSEQAWQIVLSRCLQCALHDDGAYGVRLYSVHAETWGGYAEHRA